jgi:hypothetical protein
MAVFINWKRVNVIFCDVMVSFYITVVLFSSVLNIERRRKVGGHSQCVTGDCPLAISPSHSWMILGMPMMDLEWCFSYDKCTKK